MSDPQTFSFSRVSSFEQCPRRYRYRYLDGVHEAFQSVEAFMGQQVHAALEWLFKRKEQGQVPSLEQCVAYYCSVWDATVKDSATPVKVVRGGESEPYRRSGAEMLADFYRNRFPGDQLSTVATEQHVSIRLAGRLPFQGFIDRFARDCGGRYYIIDYKTGKRVPQRFEGKDAEQLEAYALTVFADYGVDEVVLSLEYLRTGRNNTKVVRRSEAAALEQRLAARIDAALSATVFPPNPGVLCDWCGFNDLCEAARTRYGKEA